MADNDDKPAKNVSKAKEPPKPVHIGGESFLDRILPHIKKIAITLIVLSVVIAGVFAIRIHKQHVKSEDTTRIAEVIAVADRPIRGSDDKPDDKNPSFASEKDRANGVLSEMAKQDTTTTPAYRAGALFDVGKYDEAIAEYQKCAATPGVDGVVCREGIGLATEAKAAAEKDNAAQQKGLEAALAAFKAEQPQDDGPRAGYAHYHQGRILVLLNRKDEAKKEFEKAKDLGKDLIDLPELIRKRLAGLGA